MSKKAKSKQPVRRKYVTAGALGYNQSTYTADNFASPYSTNPSYYDAGAAMAAQQRMKSAMSQSDILKQQAQAGNKSAAEAQKERDQELKDAISRSKEAGVQGLQGVGMEAGATLATETAKKLSEKKALEEAAKEATKQAGTAAASQTATQAASQTAGTIATQASLKGAESLVDEAGMIVLPTATKTASGIAASGAGSAAAGNTGLLAANMSGLASAGIGLGLTGAGMFIEHKTTDYDPTTFSEKERKGNLFGSAIKGAGSGVGYGTMAGTFLPGVGNVVGAGVGALVGAGVGLAKGIKENKQSKKDAEEYAKQKAEFDAAENLRKERIAKQSADIAGAYNSAFIQSRLTGSNQGIGYGAQYKLGGYDVPGGQVVPMGGGAVEFVGRKHSQGGILLDPNTEVEGGETMDQVAMNEAKTGGKMNDYFFSAYLKLGGKSFAQRHKELIKNGANQAAIQELAKKQEAVANKKGEKDRSPSTIKEYGGPRQYQTGDFRYTMPTAPQKEYQVRQDALTDEIAKADWYGKKSGKPAPASGIMMAYGAVPGFDEREKKAQEEATTKKSNSKSSKSSKSTKKSSPKLTDSEGEFEALKEEFPRTPTQVVPTNIEDAYYNLPPNYLTNSNTDNVILSQIKDREDPTEIRLTANQKKTIAKLEPQIQKNIKKADKRRAQEKAAEANKKNTTVEGDSVRDNFTTPSVLAGLAQLIPAGYVLATPYKKTAPINTSGAEFKGQRVGVGATVKGATLGRVDSRQERAAAIANAASISKYIEGTNAGPGAIIGKLAVNAKLNDQMLKIQDADNRANLQLRAKEAELGQAASTVNAQMAMQAASQSAENLQRASENLQKAKMFNAQMEMGEKQFADQRKVAALDSAVRGIAGLTGDLLSFRAQERLSKVIDETGSYDRFKLKELMDTDPAFANLTKDQKDQIVAGMGQNAQLGGARRYTSRLGDLNRGKNKRNFNI